MPKEKTVATLIFYPENMTPPRRSMIRLNSVKLYPGRNHITEPELKVLKNHSSYERLIALNVIKFLEENPIELIKEADTSDSLVGLTVESAISLIEITYDIPLLKKWLENESTSKSRKAVVNSLNKQIQDVGLGNL